MKALFIIQGEGRGHMTQALALEQILIANGHQVSAMVLGTCNRRTIPEFFRQRTKPPLHMVKSPNFYFDKEHKSINLWKTFYLNFLQIPLFLKEIGRIHRIVKTEQPDIIINFYDILGGFYFLFSNPRTKRISLAHQYLAYHQKFPFAKGSALQKKIYQLNNFLTSINCHKKLALSFDYLESPGNNVFVVPPLLRKEIRELPISNEEFILAYVVNKGYGEEILEWHSKNQKVKLKCFWDNYDYPNGWSPRPNISFFHLNDKDFLLNMAACAGYVSTAGFESISEAMYLGKPIMMVPVKSQYEQACNALDAERVGAGKSTSQFDLSILLKLITKENYGNEQFRQWADQTPCIFIKELEGFIPNIEKRTTTLRKLIAARLNNIYNPLPNSQPQKLDHF